MINDYFNKLYCYSHQYKDVNSNGFRSDEFIKEHDGKHILFSGCSNTFGIGLEKEEIWANIVYNKISKNEKCSGFFNLGAPAAGIDYICFNLFKYFKFYGNPDLLFINLPNQLRMFHYNKNLDQTLLKVSNIDPYEILEFLNLQYYFMLEQYCFANKIKLFSFSWDHFRQYDGLPDLVIKKISQEKNIKSTNELFNENNFNTFYYINFKEIVNEVANLRTKYDNLHFMLARDYSHYGNGYHIYWADFIYNKYLTSKINMI